MCGPDTSNKPRYGALAVVSPPSSVPSSPLAMPLSGSLSLYSTAGDAGLLATQATFTGLPGCDLGLATQKYFVVIHTTGDLRVPSSKCQMFRRFDFDSGSVAGDGLSMATALAEPLQLEVGGEGVIGRRISIFAGGEERKIDNDDGSEEHEGGLTLVAEGIIGINQILSRI
ncbi:hypothetical protein MKZ38_006698 [Zalerion maritima]|uniref:Uncharacterized protein n=1 Tax=Zalerion maritima TaxID=339359 RepID=A0AAD5RIM8_9PEZI|nr:hypothetical protein MKZ38_006698 [Zalerion maritima]